MNTLQRMMVRLFIPVFLLSTVFFVLILELVDFFTNLWGYLSNEASYSMIALSILYYLPKCISFALPIALLFAASFALGSLYASNELIAVFGSGVSLFRFVLPVILIGVLASVGSFFFQERVVISTYREKNDLTAKMLQNKTSYSNSNVTVLSDGSRVIYHADFYNDATQTLSAVTVLERDANGNFEERVDADWAEWKDGAWVLHKARVFGWNSDRSFLVENDVDGYTEDKIREPPDTFKRAVRNIDEMSTSEARAWIASLRKAGLPFRGDLTDYYNRFAFAFTSFIVTFISTAIGGRFKKNILLMSLLASLVVSVVFYVTQMLAILLAKLGYISPIMGAWGAVILFTGVGLYLFRVART